MAETSTEKYIIDRITESFYQKITTISGFFTKKTSVWDDLYVKGYRYCASGWLHTSHAEYVALLNKKLFWNANDYRNFINRYADIWSLLKELCLNKCHQHSSEDDYSFSFVKKAFTGAKYKGRSVDELETLMTGHYSPSGYYFKDNYIIWIKFADGNTHRIELSSSDGEKLIDLIAMGLLTQLDTNPNCIFYYIPQTPDIVGHALSKKWLLK